MKRALRSLFPNCSLTLGFACLALVGLSSTPVRAFTAEVHIRFDHVDGVRRDGGYKGNQLLQALSLYTNPGHDATVTTKVWPANELPPSSTVRVLLIRKVHPEQSHFLPHMSDCARMAMLVQARPQEYDLLITIAISSHRTIADLKGHATGSWELVVPENRVYCEIRKTVP